MVMMCGKKEKHFPHSDYIQQQISPVLFVMKGFCFAQSPFESHNNAYIQCLLSQNLGAVLKSKQQELDGCKDKSNNLLLCLEKLF